MYMIKKSLNYRGNMFSRNTSVSKNIYKILVDITSTNKLPEIKSEYEDNLYRCEAVGLPIIIYPFPS